VIFCQGMPFSSDALAAAVARQTGSEIIIPPNPGTVGALGIALLTRTEIDLADSPALDPQRFLDARIESKETFVCGSTKGCGGSGNHCRIDSIRTLVADRRQRFNWGGACALYDKGGHKRKLPDRSPDPFREREELVRSLVGSLGESPAARSVAMTDEFMLKGMLPLFATFFRELGLNIRLAGTADHAALKRGITGANIPFCAPMQLYHGVVSRMAEESADLVFLPMIRGLGRVHDEKYAKLCPVVQASPWLLRSDLASKLNGNALTPVIDVGTGNYDSPEFRSSCAQLAAMVGVSGENLWSQALERAVAAQRGFDDACLEIGRQALSFCAGRELPVVVVVGRPYTIYNKVLNSNVPAILREQGAMALPLDCLPIDDDVPVHSSMYWAHGQQILRTAHQVRRMPDVHAIYHINRSLMDHYGWGDRIHHALLERVHGHLARSLKRCLGHCHHPSVTDTIAAASGYLPVELEGEAVLTIGAAVEHWRAGKIDAVVNVGPLECMPTKVAESQFFHVARDENLPNLTISLNGDPLNTEMLDNFAYEVHERFRHKSGSSSDGTNREPLRSHTAGRAASATSSPTAEP